MACVPDEFERAGAVYSGIPCGMKRGQLRIYLGTAAPGVGKTYAMLGEGHRRS